MPTRAKTQAASQKLQNTISYLRSSDGFAGHPPTPFKPQVNSVIIDAAFARNAKNAKALVPNRETRNGRNNFKRKAMILPTSKIIPQTFG
jgi:hypothetical protein